LTYLIGVLVPGINLMTKLWKMEGKKLKLGSDEDTDDRNKKTKPLRVPKGYLMSNNAYMLVYTGVEQTERYNNSEKKTTESTDQVNWNLPQRLKKLVEKDDQTFEDWVKEMNDTKAVSVESSKAKQQEMVNIYNILSVTDGAEFDFINSDWLVTWLTTEKNELVKPVNNSNILCIHGKLDPNCVSHTKCISTSAADLLYKKYGGGPRLFSQTSMCLPCVKLRCQIMKLKAKTAEDSKKLTTLVKCKPDSSVPLYWIGKNSLKCWRKLVLEDLEDIEYYNELDEIESSENLCRQQSNEDKLENTDMEIQSSEISSFEKSSDSTSLRSTRSKSKVFYDSYTKDSNLTDCNDTGQACDSSDVVSSPKKNNDSKKESMEIDISIVSSDNMEVNENVSSSDNVLQIGSKKLFSEKLKNKISNISLNGASKKCNTNAENTLDSMSKNIRKQTSEFCNIQSVDEICESSEVDSTVDSENNTNKGFKRRLESDECEASGMELKNPDECMQREKQEEVKLDEDDEEEMGFNEDILCTHGELCVEEGWRRLISKQAWDILKSYFPSAPTFREDVEPCSRCQDLATEGKAARDMHRQAAVLQKEKLQDLYFDRNRMTFSCLSSIQKQKQPQDQVFHLVSREFINSWRRFI
ncbi:hypothetical protein L9F63_007332, partial [Diploptera punctata]